MIKANKFQIKNLKNVIFLGYSDNFRKLKEINRDLGLKTIIISSMTKANLLKRKKMFLYLINLIESLKTLLLKK